MQSGLSLAKALCCTRNRSYMKQDLILDTQFGTDDATLGYTRITLLVWFLWFSKDALIDPARLNWMPAPGVLFSHSMPLQNQGCPEIGRIVCRQETAESLIGRGAAIHLRSTRLPGRAGAATTFVACFGSDGFPHAKRARWPGLAVIAALVQLQPYTIVTLPVPMSYIAARIVSFFCFIRSASTGEASFRTEACSRAFL